MVNKQAILKNSKLGADAYARPAPRPAALPPEDAPMSPHLDLGSWREWDRGLRHYRVAARFKKSLLWIGAPLLAVLILLHFYLSFWIYFSGIGVIMPAFFLWYLIDHALTARRRLSPRDNFFDKVIARGGLVCPQCEVPLEAASAPDRWSCSQCASTYTGQQLTRLIDGKFAKFRAADASSVLKWIYRKLGLHAATDRIALAFCSVKFAIIGLTFYLLLPSLFGLIEAEIFDHNVSVFVFLPPAFIIIGTVLIIGGIRLRREPYSRCAHCFYTVPEGIALPERCSECGRSWHAPGGLLHHRIEWRPVGYGGLVFSLLALLLLGNGMYRNWQLGQALQTPTTATTSVLIAGLDRDQGYWLDETKAVQAEVHQRNLTPLEAQALVEVYVSRYEREEAIGDLGLACLVSAMEAGELDAALVSRIRAASCWMTLVVDQDWRQGISDHISAHVSRKPGFLGEILAARVQVNGIKQLHVLKPWQQAGATSQTALVRVPYVPTQEDNEVEVTVWFSAPGVTISNAAHRTPEYLSRMQVPGVWSQVERLTRTAAAIPVLAFERQERDESVEPYFTLSGPSLIRPKPLAASEVSEIQAAKAALGGGAQDPIFEIGPVIDLPISGREEMPIKALGSSGSRELDELLVQYIKAAGLQVGEERVYVQIDLDSLNPAVAEVTP